MPAVAFKRAYLLDCYFLVYIAAIATSLVNKGL
uniref:Uncharacterized protein n=1 Tax=Psychrobacter sp. (strain PRwf-1) TaxID=349106 RepID=A5WI01_PSYWF